MATFVCPSDMRNPVRTSRGAQTNYMADMGSWIVWQSPTGPNAGLPRGFMRMPSAALLDGIFFACLKKGVRRR